MTENKPKSSKSEADKVLLLTRPICPPWDEASKNFAYFLAKNVRGVDFGILTCKEELNLGENVEQIPIYSSAKFNLKSKLELLKFLRKDERLFSIFHLLFTPTRLNTFLIKFFSKIRNVRTIQTIATLREDLYSDEKIRKNIFADAVITYSDHSKQKLESLGFQNVRRIYPGIDLEKYSPAPKNLATLELFNLDQNDFILTFPGEYTRLGGVDHIIEAFRKIEGRIKEAKLVLALRVKNKADFLKKKQIMKEIAGTELDGKIVFTDTFSDMPKIYNLSDVVLFPVSDLNGKFDVPLVVPESQACEKPVIVSDLPIFQEFTNESNSIVVKKNSPEEIYEAVLELYNDKNRRESMGRSGRQFVEANMDIKKVAKDYKEVYQELLTSN